MPQSPDIPLAPEQMADDVQHRRLIARAANGALSGKLNATGTVTLTASTTTTTLTSNRIGPSSAILLVPTTANASVAEKAGIWISARGKGTATLTHASAVAVDQTFTFVIIG